MSLKSALFAGILTLLMVLVLGNSWAYDQVEDAEGSSAFTQQSVISLVHYGDEADDERGATIARLAILVLLSAALGGIAGRARPLAAFVGGWGAFLAASVVSVGLYAFMVDDPGTFFGVGSEGLDRFTATAMFGAPLGMWLGWLVGLAVMLGSLGRGDAREGNRPWASPPPQGAYGAAPPSPGPFGAAPPTPAGDPYGTPPGPPPAPPDAAFGSPPPPEGAPPPPPDAPSPSPPAAPPGPGGPVIGAPPDRTQVFGEPPAGDLPRQG